MYVNELHQRANEIKTGTRKESMQAYVNMYVNKYVYIFCSFVFGF